MIVKITLKKISIETEVKDEEGFLQSIYNRNFNLIQEF